MLQIDKTQSQPIVFTAIQPIHVETKHILLHGQYLLTGLIQYTKLLLTYSLSPILAAGNPIQESEGGKVGIFVTASINMKEMMDGAGNL